MGEAYIRIPKFVFTAFVWAIVETTIFVGAGALGFVSPNVQWPFFSALWIIFSVAAFVGYIIGEPEDVAKALFLSQIGAIPLSFLLLLGVAPSILPAGVGYSNEGPGTDLLRFEGGLFLVLGFLLFMTSLAGSFSGWWLNGFIGANRAYSLDWKRVFAGLVLAFASIYLPLSPVIAAGLPVTAVSVAVVALLGALVARSGLHRKMMIAPRVVGFLVVAGLLVFLLSTFSLMYVGYDLFWTQCLTLVAPSLILFRLLIRRFDIPSRAHSSRIGREEIR